MLMLNLSGVALVDFSLSQLTDNSLLMIIVLLSTIITITSFLILFSSGRITKTITNLAGLTTIYVGGKEVVKDLHEKYKGSSSKGTEEDSSSTNKSEENKSSTPQGGNNGGSEGSGSKS